MSTNSSDNPLIRFVAFWWALGVFSLFGVALLVAKLFFGGGEQETSDLEAVAAAKRYETAAKIKSAQDANLAYKEVEAGKLVQVHPHDVFATVGKDLVAAKAKPVEDPAQIVPGSDRQLKGSTAPAADYAAIDKMTPPAGTKPDPAAMTAGQTSFMMMACVGCHGMEGQGMPTGPALAGNEWVTGPVSNLIRIQFRGLKGPITIKGQVHNFPIEMAAVSATVTDDAQIANVLTFVRNSWGNSAPPVLPEQVKALRSEIGKPVLTEADLTKP